MQNTLQSASDSSQLPFSSLVNTLGNAAHSPAFRVRQLLMAGSINDPFLSQFARPRGLFTHVLPMHQDGFRLLSRFGYRGVSA